MAEEDKLKYRDLIEPDDSIEKLISQLEDLNKNYETVVNAIRAGATKIASSIKSASGATIEGRRAIDEALEGATRLERAQYELKLALSDTGKQIAWLKAQTADANKATVENERYIRQATTSYDRLKSDLKQLVELYKSLSVEERLSANFGQPLLDQILELKNRIKFLDDQLKPHVTQLTEVEKAEQRLAYLQSNEGQRLLDLKAKISELTASRKKQKEVIDPIAQAQEKLTQALSYENEQLKAYNLQIKEANKIAELQAKIANSAEGSYNRLAAQYELNKIKLNAMSSAERESVTSGKKLEAETKAIYEQMRLLQEATGNYRLSVGHYQRAWDGLGFSISQVVREMPALAVSANTFFLAISNNIPLVIDEIYKLRIQNKKFQAEGKPTVNITKSIISALFSWNSALVILLSVFSVWGKDIVDWITSLFKAKNAVLSTKEALENITEELENTNGSYGENTVKLKRLSGEWQRLKTTAEKNQWIKDNKSNFDQLGISINTVSEAENAFVANTEAIVKALKARAKAAAAEKLAAEKYKESLKKEAEASQEEKNRQATLYDRATAAYKGSKGPAAYATPGAQAEASKFRSYEDAVIMTSNADEAAVKALRDKAKAAEETADVYFKLAEAELKEAEAALKGANIEPKHKNDKNGKKGRAPRDLTDILNRNDILIQKKYEESVTKLRSDEYAKRRKEAADEVQNENNKLREMYRKNEEYVKNVNKKYKNLTEAQKEQIARQQDWITKTVANNLQLLNLQLQKIEKEQQINSTRIQREAINAIDYKSPSTRAESSKNLSLAAGAEVSVDTNRLEESLAKERDLMITSTELEYKLAIETNKKLLAEGDKQARSEEELINELTKKKLEIWGSYDEKILTARATNIEDQLELVKKGSEEELQLLLQQNEIARQIALAQNLAKPAEQQVSSSVINAKFNKSRKQIRGTYELENFEQQQKLDEAVFNTTRHNELAISKFKLEQEKDRWEKQIALAQSGALNWSKKQIDAAKATVKGINNELKDLDNFISRIGEKGLGGALLENLGFDDASISALESATNTVISNLQSIMDAEVELAQKAVEAAEARVEAAQSAYEAEVEARNNGYANNVATAKKELEEEKKKQRQKQALLEEAQKRQESIDTVVQASSLVTASANLWSSLSKVPVVGPALALAAIATMWTSFAAAKIKAKQVTNQAQEYGEGGLEFLEGGSHASGNDIDLGVNNRDNKRMRAEGGEALAIINKKQTKKYRKILPDIVESLNNGNFEDKYLKAFAGSDNLNISIRSADMIDLSRIEQDISNIRKNNETRYFVMPNGSVVIQQKNVKRIIKN